MTDNTQKIYKPSPMVKIARELLSILFWLAVMLKLFVLDFDIIVITKFFPAYTWLIEYKFFIFFGAIAFFWLVVGNKIFRGSILYVLCYPLVVLFWYSPRLFFKNWTLAFLFLPSIVSTVKSFKGRFISSMFALVSCLLIILQISPVVAVLSMLTLLVYLGIHYVRQFRSAFSTSSFFGDVSKFIQKLWTSLKETTVLKELQVTRSFKQDSEEFQKKRSSILLSLFLYNRLFLFSAFKLKRIQESRIMDVYLIGSLIYTFIVTVIVFAFEYYALFRLDPTSFSGTVDHSFFFFLYGSFNTLLTVGFGDFSPVGVIARLLTSLELFTWLMIFVILFFIITSIIRERYHKDVVSLVRQLSSEGSEVENLILQEYQLSITAAEDQVKNSAPGIVKVIEFLQVRE